MRIEGRRYRDEWLPNFYPSKKIGDRFVRVSRSGKTILLNEDEDAQINEFFMSADLFERLERTGHIITNTNASKVFSGLSTWLRGTYDGPGLHIVVPTRRCNLNCTYCHMYPQPVNASQNNTDLQPETIPYIARFIMSSPRHRISVEFQGGEPFLNFPAIAQTVEEVSRLNASEGKAVNFSIVSNLMIANDEQLSYCQEHKISISYSLNGPEPVHDLFRITRNGTGSYKTVMRKIDYIKRSFPGLLARYPLCVVTEDNMGQLRDMVQYYYDLGFRGIGMIPLKNLGNAIGQVKFDMRKFIPYYLDLLEYIYDKNKTSGSVCYFERLVQLALMKILGTSNPLFVDWRNPIGYVSNCIIYDTDGELLPVDEARSLRDVFTLGNVRSMTYDELIRKRSSFQTVNLSIRDRDPVCRECAYNPYCGVSPVLHYSKTGKLEPEPHVSDECIFILALFDWVFQKLNQEDTIPLLKMAPDYLSVLSKRLPPNKEDDSSELDPLSQGYST
jgi:uncharacterized protein